MINLFSEVLGVSKMEAKYLQMLSAIELLLPAIGLSGAGRGGRGVLVRGTRAIHTCKRWLLLVTNGSIVVC